MNLNAISMLGVIWPYFLVGAICVLLGVGIGYLVSMLLSSKKTKDAYKKAAKLMDEAILKSKTAKADAILDAREEAEQIKTAIETQTRQLLDETDREVKQRKAEVQKLEERLYSKDELLIKKEIELSREKENIENEKIKLQNKEESVNKKESSITTKLEEISKYTKEQAKQEIINLIEEDAKKEASNIVRRIEADAKEDADKKAKEIIGLAIQRCATDHTSDVTVSVVNLPNDEVKGKIIGREGRNIRAIENATGVDLIVDDTPEAITVSSFDPIRREVARVALEKLILDGRIHPARIEEIVEKTKKDIENIMKEAGELATTEADIHNLHPEIVRTLGRLKYRTSYGQNVLKHSLEVCFLAGLMASELGANVNLAKRGGLLHDLGKAVDFEKEGTHVQLGVELARKFKESEAVINCIESHHGDVEPKSVEAILVQAADAISSSRPGARKESLENYIKRLRQLEAVADSFKGVEKSYAIQAGREIRIIVKPTEIDDSAALFMAKDIAKKIESEMEYPGQIKVNVIRETRNVEYAK